MSLAILLALAATTPETQPTVAPTSQPAVVTVDGQPVPRGAKKSTLSCREMLMSSSRLGTVKVCKTRAEWRRWDDCHRSVTRYCTPKKKEVQVTGMSPNEKLVCKYVAETGTRIGRQRLCATKREWELVALETQEAIRNRQSQSSLVDTQTIFANPIQGAGPQ